VADIFVSYAREDRDAVRTLAAHLAEVGWSVWWDRHILAGKDFDEVLQRELDKARCVLVAWSSHSVASRWVKAEAGEGLRREILVPIQLDAALPPLNFRNIQTVTFPDRSIAGETPAFAELVEALTDLLGKPVRPELVAPPVAAQAAPAPVQAGPSLIPESPQPKKDDRVPRSRLPLGIVLGLAAVALVSFLVAFYGGGRDRARDAVTAPTASVSGPAKPPKQEPPPAPAPVPTGEANAKPPDAKPADPSSPIRPEGLSDAAMRDFVGRLLKAAASGDVDRVLPFYADSVDYYAMGPVGQDQIRQDKQAYYTRWPEIKLLLADAPSVAPGDSPDTVAVTYLSTYEVASPARRTHAGGATTTVLQVALVNGAPKIVRQRETVRAARQ
jgi:hypothetical protein